MGRSGAGPEGGVAVAALLLCIGSTGVAATSLHLASDRADAAWLALLAWPWALAALLAALRAPARWLTPVGILGLALLIRGPLIGTPPLLSDDVYRYLFEGHALLAGHNPFLTAPAELPGVADALRERVNHPEIPTIYPPVALLWFVLLALGGGTVVLAQIGSAVADLAIVGAALALGPRARRGALLLALHPLLALESASGAHLEALAIAGLAWAIVAARTGPALAILGAGIKVFPILLLPPLARRAGPRAAALGIAVATLGLVLIAIPVLAAGPSLLTAATNYARHWSFNGLLYPPISAILGPQAARIKLGVAGLGATVAAWWVARDRPLVAWMIIGAAFLALTPTAHPWYALWLFVPAALLGRWGLALAATAPLGGYLVLLRYDADTGAWAEPSWLWAATWLPAIAAVGWELARWNRARRPTAPTSPKPAPSRTKKGTAP